MPTIISLKRAIGLISFIYLAAALQTCQAFDLQNVVAHAKALANQPYHPPKSNLSPVFSQMQFADYQQIRFKLKKAYWGDDHLPFKLEFYHQGMQFDTPVKIDEINDFGSVQAIRYTPNYFSFGNVRHDATATKNLGFAGFKVLYHLNPDHNWDDEIASFLGASYFRVIGPNQVYGLSARGLAIDTGESRPEEFPRFKHYWIKRPVPGSHHLLIYALMDSPSATGAYQFKIYPNQNGDARVDIKSRIILRKPVDRLGIAPLTSMFLFGPNQPSKVPNYRHALHDSNGLAIHTGKGEWIWRPLENPKHVTISSFSMTNPKGFGLLQRGRDFNEYEDLKDRYDRRPSGWVVPDGSWGKGKVVLIELPSPNETNDNIVAFWKPAKQPQPGQILDLNYHIDFSTHENRLRSKKLGYVVKTMRSPGNIYQSNLIRHSDGTTAFLIDFAGGELSQLSQYTPDITSQISIGPNARLMSHHLQYNPVIKGWRLDLRIKVKNPSQNVEMRANLTQNGHPITETWSYLLTASK